MRTRITWDLHNYCTGGCSYCPARYWGGDIPRGILEYLNVTNKLINNYKEIGRSIDWKFGGGEPLDMFDFPAILKLCKENDGTIELTTNGGKMWLDWFAIEPHVDVLNLTYHYWQNPKLITFIIQSFKGKNKKINLTVPIRNDHFDVDWTRAESLEREHDIQVIKSPLYNEAYPALGPITYTEKQYEKLFGIDWVNEHIRKLIPQLSHEEKSFKIVEESPSYTGKLCNVGIENLHISHDGWVSGSYCNNTNIGNLWNDTLALPQEPQPCKMVVCVNSDDQKIMKFL